MAKNLVKALGETTKKRGQNLLLMLSDALAKDTWINKGVLQTIVNRVNRHVKDVEDFEESLDNGTDVGDMPMLQDDDDLVRTIADALAFSVPRDIWELLYQSFSAGDIPKKEMSAYIRLDMSTDEFAQVLKFFDAFVAPYNEKTPKHDDDEYEAPQPTKKRRRNESTGPSKKRRRKDK
jgi:hypothetical protein